MKVMLLVQAALASLALTAPISAQQLAPEPKLPSAPRPDLPAPVSQAPPAPKPGVQPKYAAIFKGKCEYQIVQGYFPCKEFVTLTFMSNGRSFLGFMTEDGETMFTLNGGPDRQPNLENYYLSIDTIRMLKGATILGEGNRMEGECHFTLNKDATVFYSIECDVYNRQKHSMYNFRLKDITATERKLF